MGKKIKFCITHQWQSIQFHDDFIIISGTDIHGWQMVVSLKAVWYVTWYCVDIQWTPQTFTPHKGNPDRATHGIQDRQWDTARCKQTLGMDEHCKTFELIGLCKVDTVCPLEWKCLHVDVVFITGCTEVVKMTISSAANDENYSTYQRPQNSGNSAKHNQTSSRPREFHNQCIYLVKDQFPEWFVKK